MRRWVYPVTILAVMSLWISGFPLSSGTDIDRETSPNLLLVRVAPSTPLEFITIQNVSNSTSDLLGMSLDDGEGWIKVNATILLEPGERMTFSPDPKAFSTYYPEDRALAYRDERLLCHGTLALADKGDQVNLIGPGGALDSFCYGVATLPSGWTGSPFTPLPKGDMAARDLTVADSDTSSDWYRSCAGRSEMAVTSFPASVDPFTCPEGALDRMIREIGYARESIAACVYEMGNPVVTKLFCDAEERGVRVSVMLEGQPVTGLSNASKTAISAMVTAGCDVRLMTSNQSYRRYDCLHAKYLVVDQERVTVMSENWAGGLVSNRGWGVTAVSRDLTEDVTDMFLQDSSLDRRDVKEASAVVNDWYSPPGQTEIPGITGSATQPVAADVSLIVSPDTSFQGLLRLVSSSTKRLLVEQLYVDPAWVGKNQIIDGLVEAAARGVQVRVLLDRTFVDTSDTRNNSMTVDALNTLARQRGLDLEARLLSDYHDLGVLHNKGVIADDQVLVSSINWVDASVFQNREVGLAVSSPSVANYFADFFWRDWAIDPDPPSISLPWNNLTLIEGQPLVLDATRCRDNAGISSFLWTDALSGQTWNGSYVMAYLGLGIHRITLNVTDRFNNTSSATVLVVLNPPVSGEEVNFLIVVPAGGAALALVIWVAWKRNNRR